MAHPTETTAILQAILRETWGYDTFRPLQIEAMCDVLEGRDSVTVLPTGGGKSLCYQAPALARPGMAVVVSPLIALMKDQVDALQARGIDAACVNSSMSVEERRAVAEAVRSDRLKLLYAAPERLVTDRFIAFLKEHPPSFFAVDEAHCISSWGHDFRPEYRALAVLREAFPGVSVHAYTATATPQVREDIATQLRLENPAIRVGSFYRPNLVYRAARRSDRLAQVRAIVDAHRDESGVIYCISRRNVDELTADLRELGYRAVPYHAGLPDDQRKSNQEAFIRDAADIVVATVAFGMGIDKPNVRYVVHAGMPKSIEHYQQESGRAGRDGLEAECHLLYAASDFQVWNQLLGKQNGPATEAALAKLRDMYGYCTSLECRHTLLTGYFGETLDMASCGACDVCLDDVNTVSNAGALATAILEGVRQLGERFGAHYTAEVLAGARSAKVEERGHAGYECHGSLSAYTRPVIREWIDQLIAQDFLRQVGEYNVVELSSAGRAFLAGGGDAAPRLLEPDAPSRRPKAQSAAKAASWDGVDVELFELLRATRRAVAEAQGVPPYVVFDDAALRGMARLRPSTPDTLLAVRGVGRYKADRYGSEFLPVIRDYCEDRHIGMDVGLHYLNGADSPPPPEPRPRPKADAKARAFEGFSMGYSIEEVAGHVHRALSTVEGYLIEYIDESGTDDPSPWVDGATAQRIREAADQSGDSRLKPIREALGESVSYAAIRVVLACRRNAPPGA